MCADKTLISPYHVSGARAMSIWNDSVAWILGEGQVKLELSSETFLKLDGVYHVSNIRKNLISLPLLDQHGDNVNFGSNKVAISRHRQFVGKGFLLDGLYRLSVMPSSRNGISDSQLSVTNIECCDTCHGWLGHMNKNTI